MTINKLAQNIGLEIEDFIEIFEIYRDATTADMQELKAALKAGDPQGVSRKAHSIKGASVNLGLNELFELAKEIEDNARESNLNRVEGLVRNFSERYEKTIADLKKAMPGFPENITIN